MKRLLLALAVVSLVVGVSTASASRLSVVPSSLTTLSAGVVQPLVLATANGGATAGLAEAGDSVVVTFPKALDASTVCSTWAAAPTSPVVINGNNDVTVSISAAGVLTLSAKSCGGVLRFGSVDLGSPAFGPATFAGNGANGRSSVTYDPAARTLTVVLGTKTGTTAAVAATTAVFTPDPALRYGDASSVTPATGSSTGVQL